MYKIYDEVMISPVLIGRKEHNELKNILSYYNTDLPAFVSFVLEWWLRRGHVCHHLEYFGSKYPSSQLPSLNSLNLYNESLAQNIQWFEHNRTTEKISEKKGDNDAKPCR